MSRLGHASRRLGYRAATGDCRFKPRIDCDFDFGDSFMRRVANCRAISQVRGVGHPRIVLDAPEHVDWISRYVHLLSSTLKSYRCTNVMSSKLVGASPAPVGPAGSAARQCQVGRTRGGCRQSSTPRSQAPPPIAARSIVTAKTQVNVSVVSGGHNTNRHLKIDAPALTLDR